MTAPDVAYLVLGGALVVALAAVTVHYYARKRKRQVEEPKYRMLDDD